MSDKSQNEKDREKVEGEEKSKYTINLNELSDDDIESIKHPKLKGIFKELRSRSKDGSGEAEIRGMMHQSSFDKTA